MLNFILGVLLTCFTIAYPVLWLYGISPQSLIYFPYMLAVLWLVKAIIEQRVLFRCFFLGFSVFLLMSGLTKTLDSMYWYPVIINGLMLLIFASSLLTKQTIIERFARIKNPSIPVYAILYIRNVTKVWCLFFIINIGLSLSFIYIENYRAWAIYNGIISYVIMGILFIGEWLIRQYMIKRNENRK